jgi:hypothetical protein
MPSDNFWTIERIALLGTVSDREIAKRLGIPVSAVHGQRTIRNIPPWKRYKWGETELGLLRTYTDQEIAELTGRSLFDIAAKRRELSK